MSELIASSLKEASTLTAELLAFKVKINSKGHDWRENPHDVLVLATALACMTTGRTLAPHKTGY